MGTALVAVTAVCAVACVVFLGVSASHGARRTELWGWTKDSLESGDAKISAEEVEQLNSILDAQDNLKKNLQRMAEKLDKGRQVGLERKAPPHAKHEVIPERNATTDATI